jgi:hypothetical protein
MLSAAKIIASVVDECMSGELWRYDSSREKPKRNLSQYHFLYQQSCMDLPEIEPPPLQ